MVSARHHAGQQRKKGALERWVACNSAVLALPAGVQKRDEILFKAVFPVVVIKRWHGYRKPPDSGKHETSDGRLSGEIQKSGHNLRHTKPSLCGPRKYALHCGDGRGERGILSKLIHTGIEAEQLKHHAVEVVGATTTASPD